MPNALCFFVSLSRFATYVFRGFVVACEFAIQSVITGCKLGLHMSLSVTSASAICHTCTPAVITSTCNVELGNELACLAILICMIMIENIRSRILIDIRGRGSKSEHVHSA